MINAKGLIQKVRNSNSVCALSNETPIAEVWTASDSAHMRQYLRLLPDENTLFLGNESRSDGPR